MKIISVTPVIFSKYGPYKADVTLELYPSFLEFLRRLFLGKYNRKYVTRSAISAGGCFWYWRDSGLPVEPFDHEKLSAPFKVLSIEEELKKVR